MSRRARILSTFRTSSRAASRRRSQHAPFAFRPLRFELLEDRRPLAITVNTLVDEADGSIVDGDISLRDAIAASPAGGVINFSVTGTINLALGEVLVQDRILEGPGAAQLTINAHDASRVFTTRGTTTLAGLTITGGEYLGFGGGGGISNETSVGAEGILTVRDSIVTGNSAARGGGIYTGGYVGAYSTLTVINSTISGNNTVGASPPNGRGGGIYGRYALVRVDKSTISGNVATNNGGGIYGLGVRVTNSTVTGNGANFGAGIFGRGTIANSTISGNTGGLRGAVYLQSGLVTNSTISGNGTGIEGSCVVANSTITGNLFGVNGFGTITLTNSIIAGNSLDIVGAVDVAASRNNLIGSDARFDPDGPDNPRTPQIENPLPPIGLPAGGLSDGVNGNLVGVPNFGLGPLADNGGPTKTHALWSFSPAVNRGNNSLVPIDPSTGLPFTTDQTGAPRIYSGGTVDMGAVELQATPFVSTVVNTTADDVAPNALTSLREAVGFAPLLGGAVTFDPTVFATPQTIALVHGEVTVDGTSVPVTISGPGASTATVDAGGASKIFDSYGTTTISGLKITGGGEGGGGSFEGAIRNNSGTLSIQHSVVSGNAITGVMNLGDLTNPGTLTVSNSTFLDNHGAEPNCGAIQNDFGSTATISNSTISGNSGKNGGGIRNEGTLTISNSTISGNSGSIGGGIDNLGTLTISNSTISGNSASDIMGGGVNDGDELTIVNSIIVGNTAGGMPRDVVDSSGNVNPASAYNLIGDAASAGGLMNGVNGNIVGVNPLLVLGPLADNGGLTMTHALLAGSPAIDAGDPAAVAGVGNIPQYDQRGEPFTRVLDGDGIGGLRIDIGAFEAPTVPPQLPGDYNLDGNVDAADYVFWRKVLGTSVSPPFVGADGDGDSTVDPSDYDVWTENFGETLIVAPALFGDYNRDDFVDVADYVVWRKTLGTTGVPAYSAADGNGNTEIDSGDYDVWHENYGELLMAGAGGAGAWGEPPAEPGAVGVASDSTHTVDAARQPPALPGVVWFDSMNVRRTTGKPPAEPGADGRFVASYGKRDDALAAWLASCVWERSRQWEHVDDDILGGERFERGSEALGDDVDAVFELLAFDNA